MAKTLKNRASKQKYVSQNQLTIESFETPFSQKLDSKNRWVVLAANNYGFVFAESHEMKESAGG